MRNHRAVTKAEDRFLSHEKLNRLSAYQGQEVRKKSIDNKNKAKPDAV